MPTYEAMFLMNPAVAPEWPAAEAEIRRLLDRGHAKVLAMKKWDDRKLAYEIEGHKRGTYGLVFFEADSQMVTPLERDAQLSEAVLRLLVLRHERITAEQIDKVMSAAAPPKHSDTRSEWGGDQRHERGPRFGGDRRPEPAAPASAPAVEEELEPAADA